MLSLNFGRHLLHQVFVVAMLTFAAFVCREGAFYVLGGDAGNWLLVMALGGLLYLAVSLLIFDLAPSLVGIDRREVLAFLKEALSKSENPLSRNATIP